MRPLHYAPPQNNCNGITLSRVHWQLHSCVYFYYTNIHTHIHAISRRVRAVYTYVMSRITYVLVVSSQGDDDDLLMFPAATGRRALGGDVTRT